MKHALIAFVLILATVPAIAQDDYSPNNTFSIGLALNADSMGIGLGYYNTSFNDSFGFYINSTIDFTAPVDDIETQDYPWFSWHNAVETKYEHYIFNGGLVVKAADMMLFYGGIGCAAMQGVTHYQSEVSNLNYWVYDSDYTFDVNFNGGAILKFSSSFGIDGGFNSSSKGGYVNLAFSF